MIRLNLRLLSYEGDASPFALRIQAGATAPTAPNLALAVDHEASRVSIASTRATFSVQAVGLSSTDLDGDVLMVFPTERRAVRLLRRASNSNTILLTEECDQRCAMCSQPPKPLRYDHFDLYRQAVELAPANAMIGISGGEPLLLKAPLLAWLRGLAEARPDITFHVLTNGQHLEWADADALAELRGNVLWGVPLYAPAAGPHDSLVGKAGAFERLLQSLDLLRAAGAAVELRTVVMRPNLPAMPRLASFVATHLRWVTRWALMQLECRGYARLNWQSLFADTSAHFAPIAAAARIAEIAGIAVSLFNFPLCTVPEEWRELAAPSISDWKQRFMPACAICARRADCGGFFAWHPDEHGFSGLRPL